MESKHTPTDTAMENLAILDGMKRDGWSETVIDRVERTVNAHEELLRALKAVEVSLIGDEHYQEFKPLLMTVRNAIAKAEGK